MAWTSFSQRRKGAKFAKALARISGSSLWPKRCPTPDLRSSILDPQSSILNPRSSTIRVCPLPPDDRRAAQRVAVDEQWGLKQCAEQFGGHHFARVAAGDQASVFDQSHAVGEFGGQIDLV